MSSMPERPCAIYLFTGEGMPECWRTCPLGNLTQEFRAVTGLTSEQVEALENAYERGKSEDESSWRWGIAQQVNGILYTWNRAHPDHPLELEDCLQIPGAMPGEPFEE